MRLKFQELTLLGPRGVPFRFQPGMNVVVGPIHSGKTSLWRLMRFALGARRPSIVPPEVAQFVKSVDADILFENGPARVLRPFVATDTALVNIDQDGQSEILPAREPTSLSDQTYDSWMLHRLGLPSVQVRQRRRDPESPLIPLSLADFLEWCFLEQDSLEKGLFNAAEFYGESKRRYVFEYVYQLSDVELANAEAELSEVLNQLGILQHRYQIITEFLRRAQVATVEEVKRHIAAIDAERATMVGRPESIDVPGADRARRAVVELDRELVRLEQQALAEVKAAEDLRSLGAQLRTQLARLNRALLAGSALVDFEFVDCPRCGQSLPARSELMCPLCGQPDSPTVDATQLREEQRRIQGQLEETRGLLDARQQAAAAIRDQETRLIADRQNLARRLEELTNRYVSDRQQMLEQQARRLGELDAERARFVELERMYSALEELSAGQENLLRRRTELEETIRRKREQRAQQRGVFEELEAIFAEVLDRVGLRPLHGETRQVLLDPVSYQPEIEGRSFESLSSAGLRVVVNLAHAITHHIYAGRHHASPLPRLLVIDSPRKNLGRVGYDIGIGDRVYEQLIELAESEEMDTQVIVFDNGVPDVATDFVRYTFDQQNRLIPV